MGAGPQALFRGILPRAPVLGVPPGAPFRGRFSPDSFFFRGAAPDPVRSSREWLFISFSWKKETKQRKSTGCMNFTKNSTFFPKMLKLRSFASSNR